MAINPLHHEFIIKQRNIALGDRALIAIAAHVEVRSVLRAAPRLRAHKLDDVLIGSYARRVSTWPGKDVDVFGRLMADTIDSLGPDAAYELFLQALEQVVDSIGQHLGCKLAGPRHPGEYYVIEVSLRPIPISATEAVSAVAGDHDNLYSDYIEALGDHGHRRCMTLGVEVPDGREVVVDQPVAVAHEAVEEQEHLASAHPLDLYKSPAPRSGQWCRVNVPIAPSKELSTNGRASATPCTTGAAPAVDRHHPRLGPHGPEPHRGDRDNRVPYCRDSTGC